MVEWKILPAKKVFFCQSVRGFYVKRNKIMTMAGPIMEKREVELPVVLSRHINARCTTRRERDVWQHFLILASAWDWGMETPSKRSVSTHSRLTRIALASHFVRREGKKMYIYVCIYLSIYICIVRLSFCPLCTSGGTATTTSKWQSKKKNPPACRV